jgi:hypothetical protein
MSYHVSNKIKKPKMGGQGTAWAVKAIDDTYACPLVNTLLHFTHKRIADTQFPLRTCVNTRSLIFSSITYEYTYVASSYLFIHCILLHWVR